MTHPKYVILFHAFALWAAAAGIGAVAGWSVSFFGYGILPLSVVYGWIAGKMLTRLGAHNPTVLALLLFTSGIIARLAVAAYLLRQPDTTIPPYGAWQTITDMVIPWPVPAIALFVFSITSAISIRHLINKQTQGLNPCEQHSHHLS